MPPTHKRQKLGFKKPSVVIVDLFAGISAGVAALMQFDEVEIVKIICVQIRPIALSVAKAHAVEAGIPFEGHKDVNDLTEEAIFNIVGNSVTEHVNVLICGGSPC